VSAVSESIVGRRDQDELAVVAMTNYAQSPVGWWQDAKGRMQPPGSYLAPARRLPAEGATGAEGATATSAPRGRIRKWTMAVLHGRP
jgi:hypothetical protein